MNRLLVIALLLLLCACSGCCERTYHRYQLVQLNLMEGVEGNFFLGCGYIDSEVYYYAYVKEERGIRLRKFSIEECFIYQDATKDTAYVASVSDCSGYWYEFHIPSNSIINEYNVNFKEGDNAD